MEPIVNIFKTCYLIFFIFRATMMFTSFLPSPKTHWIYEEDLVGQAYTSQEVEEEVADKKI
jgi:hypothetical protein